MTTVNIVLSILFAILVIVLFLFSSNGKGDYSSDEGEIEGLESHTKQVYTRQVATQRVPSPTRQVATIKAIKQVQPVTCKPELKAGAPKAIHGRVNFKDVTCKCPSVQCPKIECPYCPPVDEVRPEMGIKNSPPPTCGQFMSSPSDYVVYGYGKMAEDILITNRCVNGVDTHCGGNGFENFKIYLKNRGIDYTKLSASEFIKQYNSYLYDNGANSCINRDIKQMKF